MRIIKTLTEIAIGVIPICNDEDCKSKDVITKYKKR